ncbi:hypothetical protein [Methylocella sp.]|uniref:hypothetical protein n=1 Tax=Methylocella sp. TaxID=1978226 RepID=UPI003C1FA1C7
MRELDRSGEIFLLESNDVSDLALTFVMVDGGRRKFGDEFARNAGATMGARIPLPAPASIAGPRTCVIRGGMLNLNPNLFCIKYGSQPTHLPLLTTSTRS